MSGMPSYSEAVRLLGGRDDPVVLALNRVSQGLLFGAAPTVPALLRWLDARGEFVRLNRDLIHGVGGHGARSHRIDRTRRLTAAHTVVVVLAYFEALDAVPMSFNLDLHVTTARDRPTQLAHEFVAAVTAAGGTVPEPHESEAEFTGQLEASYRRLSAVVRLCSPSSNGVATPLDGVAHAAIDRHRELTRMLADDFPEIVQWRDAAAPVLVPSFGRLEQLLTAAASDRAPGELRAGLTRAYRAALDRPVIPSDELPAGMRVPTLSAGYVAPLYRVTGTCPDSPAGDEERWEALASRADLDDFLTGFLTSPRATRAPLVVLGQPGAGKSLLCRVLAARLPATDFVPVLVSLREVAAVADIQDQIEQAVRAATTTRVDWPDLAGGAAGALPVVMLDGFDELLQATGVSHSDYLIRAAAFQQRELDQNRAVAILVTTRTSVADRARMPAETLLLRLDPFDQNRIGAWLGPWNRANAGYFRDRHLQPLTVTALAPYAELSGQPLLLLMLALYDADSNALRTATDDPMSHNDLYERLLRLFAAREVSKHHPALATADLDRAVDDELRRLSIIAFAMLNRGRQWISDTELEQDLTAILGHPDTTPAQVRSRLSQAVLMIGRFFFVHRAQAIRDDAVVATYEFLHATFGEYLVARLTWQALRDTAARTAVSSLPFNRADHGLLYALLSFAALTVRTPTIRFLSGMAVATHDSQRREYADLLLRLFHRAGHPQPRDSFADYQPRSLPVAARQAAYSANLLVLAVITADVVLASQLYPECPQPVYAWHDDTLLWHSQLHDEEWDSLIDALAIERIGSPQRRLVPNPVLLPASSERDLRITLDDGTFEVPPTDPFWSWDIAAPPAQAAFTTGGWLTYLRRRNHIQCGANDDELLHSVLPLVTGVLVPAVRTHIGWQGPPYRSAAQVLLEVWLLPTRTVPADERSAAYRRCAEIAAYDFPPWSQETQTAYTRMLLDALAVDEHATAETTADVLTLVTASTVHDTIAIAGAILRCARAGLSREPLSPHISKQLTDLIAETTDIYP
jgi:hypothetical protein